MKFYLVRHGQYVWESAGARGPGLSAHGRAQARQAGAFLQTLGAKPTALWVSPYQRALETAGEIEGVLGTIPERLEERALLPEGDEEEVLQLLAAWQAQDAQAEVVAVSHMGLVGRLARRLDPLAPGCFDLCTVAVFEASQGAWKLVTSRDCGRLEA